MGKGYVCHLPFEGHDDPLPSTKRVVLHTNYSTEGTRHKHSKQSQTNNLSNRRYLFSHLALLRCCDLKDMVKDHE
jgi:hypothetical protein